MSCQVLKEGWIDTRCLISHQATHLKKKSHKNSILRRDWYQRTSRHMMHVTNDSHHHESRIEVVNKHIKTNPDFPYVARKAQRRKYYNEFLLKILIESDRDSYNNFQLWTLLKSHLSRSEGAECAGNSNDDFNGIIFYRETFRPWFCSVESKRSSIFVPKRIVIFKTTSKKKKIGKGFPRSFIRDHLSVINFLVFLS